MAIDVSPHFAVALRGYDKDQVDQYLQSISHQADEQLYELQEQVRYFEEERQRLLARIDDLEHAVRTETPRSISALGERLTLILGEAEDSAAETVAEAEARADFLVSEAQREAENVRRQAEMALNQGNETLAEAQRQAEALAERLEEEARSRAASIVADAQARAQRRHDQIEAWAQEVISRTQAEQVRMQEEFAKVRRAHEAELNTLLGERDDAIAALRSLQGSLLRAIDRMPASDPAPAAAAAAIAAERAADRAEHTGSHPVVEPDTAGGESDETQATSSIPASGWGEDEGPYDVDAYSEAEVTRQQASAN